MSDGNIPTDEQPKIWPSRNKRGGTKRPPKRVVARSNLVRPTTIEWVKWTIVPQPPQPPNDLTVWLKDFTVPIPRQMSPGDLFVYLIKAGYYEEWKKADPEGFLVYQATFAVAPHCPREWGWALDLTAIVALIHGASRIFDRGKNR
jgi:hypothetical protein